MKSISTILVIVLLTIVIVALIYLLYLFSSSIFGSTTSVAEESVTETTKKIAGQLVILRIDLDGKITIKNSGPIALSDIKIYANDTEVASDDTVLEINNLLTIDLALEEGTYDFFATSDYATSLHKIGKIITELLYQENADETEFTGNVIDGDWGTYADMGCCEWYINYSKPFDTSGAIYRVKDNVGEENLTVPSSCWVYDPNKIRLKMIWGDGAQSQSWLCYDGGWVVMRFNSDLINNYVYEEAIWWIKT